MATRPHFPRAPRWGFAARSFVLLIVALCLAAPTPVAARPSDPGNVPQLRTATRMWLQCRHDRQPLVRKAAKTAKTARKAQTTSEAWRSRIQDLRDQIKTLLKEARSAKKAAKRAKKPAERRRLRDLALQKLAAADTIDKRIAKLKPKAASAADKAAGTKAKAENAAKALAAKPCPKPVWSPRNFTAFNYPKGGKATRTTIRFGVLSAIKNSPPGSRIRIAVYSFYDPAIGRALIAAARRGVSVQVIGSINDINAESHSWKKLRRTLGNVSPTGAQRTSSWVRVCVRSCRGYGGYLHTKIYLFSHVGSTRWVSMLSSANLTKFAVKAQWNHLDTVVGRSTYVEMNRIFEEMIPDRPVAKPFQRFKTRELSGMVFPSPGTRAKADPFAPELDKIQCRTSKVVPHRKADHKTKKAKRLPTEAAKPRTRVRISMYSWFDDRGVALAKLVRRKWDQGCDVKIVVAVVNKRTRAALRHSGGRGPIPMRMLERKDWTGKPVLYNHSKYVAIDGLYAGTRQKLVWTGSMNFTGFGFSNDELVVRLNGARVHDDYARNFVRVWRSHQTSRPVRVG